MFTTQVELGSGLLTDQGLCPPTLLATQNAALEAGTATFQSQSAVGFAAARGVLSDDNPGWGGGASVSRGLGHSSLPVFSVCFC